MNVKVKEPESLLSCCLQGGAAGGPGAVSHICGVINMDRADRFRGTLFRMMRSNVVTTILPINEELTDPYTGEKVRLSHDRYVTASYCVIMSLSSHVTASLHFTHSECEYF